MLVHYITLIMALVVRVGVIEIHQRTLRQTRASIGSKDMCGAFSRLACCSAQHQLPYVQYMQNIHFVACVHTRVRSHTFTRGANSLGCWRNLWGECGASMFGSTRALHARSVCSSSSSSGSIRFWGGAFKFRINLARDLIRSCERARSNTSVSRCSRSRCAV